MTALTNRNLMTTSTPNLTESERLVTLAYLDSRHGYAIRFNRTLDEAAQQLFAEHARAARLTHVSRRGAVHTDDVYLAAHRLREAGWDIRVTTARNVTFEADIVHLSACFAPGDCGNPAHFDDAAAYQLAAWRDQEDQFNSNAVRVGTRKVNADSQTVRDAQKTLSIVIVDRNTRTPDGTLHNIHRIIVNATDDAADIHDDIVENRLASVFDRLRVDEDGTMWGDTADVHAAREALAGEGWNVTVANRRPSN